MNCNDYYTLTFLVYIFLRRKSKMRHSKCVNIDYSHLNDYQLTFGTLVICLFPTSVGKNPVPNK